jgi:hypothetical protein
MQKNESDISPCFIMSTFSDGISTERKVGCGRFQVFSILPGEPCDVSPRILVDFSTHDSLVRCQDLKFGLCATASESSPTQCLPSFRAIEEHWVTEDGHPVAPESSGTRISRVDNAPAPLARASAIKSHKVV